MRAAAAGCRLASASAQSTLTSSTVWPSTTPASRPEEPAGAVAEPGALAIRTSSDPFSADSALPGRALPAELTTAADTALLAVADSGLNCGSVPTGVPSRSRAGAGQTSWTLPAGTAASAASSGLAADGCGARVVAATRPPPAARMAAAESTPATMPRRPAMRLAPPERLAEVLAPAHCFWQHCSRQPSSSSPACRTAAPATGVPPSFSSLCILVFLTQGAFVPGQAGIGAPGRHRQCQQDRQADYRGLEDAGPERPRAFIPDSHLAGLRRQRERLGPAGGGGGQFVAVQPG